MVALFIPIVYLAMNEKKWYLYLTFAFFGTLPEQLGFRLAESLPMISASRILVALMMCFWCWDRWKKRNFTIPKTLLIFVITNLVISFVNLRYGMGEIKRIFSLVFEQALLVIMVVDTIETRKEFDKCVDFMIMGCTVVAIMGIVQNVFEYDIASVLHLTETMASIQLLPRMGMIRAYGTFNAITLGCFNVFMLFPIYYRLINTKKIRYSVAMALNLMALICTFTRSAWICAAVAFVTMVLLHRKQFIQNIWRSVVLTLAVCAALCVVQPKLYSALLETGKSVLNTVFGVAYDSASVVPVKTATAEATAPVEAETEATAPAEAETEATVPAETVNKIPYMELSEDFGANQYDPTYSRMMQWSAIERIAEDGELLFGYGYNFLQSGRLYFYLYEEWTQVDFVDVGIVALVAESGLAGAAVMLAFIMFIFLHAFCKKTKTAEFDFYKVTLYIIPMLLLLNYVSVFLSDNTVWLFFALVYANMKLSEMKTKGNSEQVISN